MDIDTMVEFLETGLDSYRCCVQEILALLNFTLEKREVIGTSCLWSPKFNFGYIRWTETGVKLGNGFSSRAWNMILLSSWRRVSKHEWSSLTNHENHSVRVISFLYSHRPLISGFRGYKFHNVNY